MQDFSSKLKVTRPDGKPVTGANIRITARRGYFSFPYDKQFTVKNGYIVDFVAVKTIESLFRTLEMKVG